MAKSRYSCVHLRSWPLPAGNHADMPLGGDYVYGPGKGNKEAGVSCEGDNGGRRAPRRSTATAPSSSPSPPLSSARSPRPRRTSKPEGLLGSAKFGDDSIAAYASFMKLLVTVCNCDAAAMQQAAQSGIPIFSKDAIVSEDRRSPSLVGGDGLWR